MQYDKKGENSSSNSDPRNRKTRMYIRQAFTELLYDKSAYNITVKELCLKAQINRATFYAHYMDINDFLTQTVNDVANGLVDAIISSNPKELFQHGKAEKLYTEWFKYIQKNNEIFFLLLGEHGLQEFQELLIRQGIEWYTKILRDYTNQFENEVALDTLSNYVVSAHIGLMRFYLNSGRKYSPEYMAKQLALLTFSGPMSTLKLISH